MPQIWRRLPFQLRGVVVQPVRRSLKKKATGRLAYLKEAAISQSDAFLSTTRRIFWFIVVIADYAISFFFSPSNVCTAWWNRGSISICFILESIIFLILEKRLFFTAMDLQFSVRFSKSDGCWIFAVANRQIFNAAIEPPNGNSICECCFQKIVSQYYFATKDFYY